jgi:sialate O-acetylesterase
MQKVFFRGIILSGILLFVLSSARLAIANSNELPFVSPVFGDNMVLQRDKTNTIWGWTDAGTSVRVEIAGRTASTVAKDDGSWQAQIVPPAPGGPYVLSIDGPKSVRYTNVLVGDVWLCGGQSNMEWPLARARNGEQEVKKAHHPSIRLFTVKNRAGYSPERLVDASWKICSPETVTQDGGVSAVGYYFALKIRSETNVPIGLVKNCVGGTPAESWTSAAGLREFTEFAPALAEVDRLRSRGGPQYGNYIMHWYDEFDVGQQNGSWTAPGLDATEWKTVTIPEAFSALGVPETPAVCYFRKTVTLPDPLPAGRTSIHLGSIERMDTTYINGKWVGASAWVENPRVYTAPDRVLKPGTNVITIRVFKVRPNGGFLARPEQMRLVLGDKTEIALGGEWKAKLSVDARPPHPLPLSFENWPVMPTVLHNGMIAPVAPLGIAGVIWYQGEANTSRASQYRRLLPALITDWRATFGQGDFPFYIVSLAAFMQHRNVPGDDSWAELREAQALTARRVPNSGLALAIDLGDANDIHPIDKKEVGERLALWALAKHYGRKVVFSGPTFASMEALPGALKLRFDNTDGGLVVRGETLGEFSIAGPDGKWHWAEARIEDDSVIVSSPQVPAPKAARYAWQANPVATLYNGAGLPAVPFRTDAPSQ